MQYSSPGNEVCRLQLAAATVRATEVLEGAGDAASAPPQATQTTHSATASHRNAIWLLGTPEAAAPQVRDGGPVYTPRYAARTRSSSANALAAPCSAILPFSNT